jgi:cobalt-zinc-cadmium efflux system membrane fusion protein
MTRTKLFLLGLGLLAAAGLAGCDKGHAHRRAAPQRWPRMETVQPTRASLPVRVELAVTLEPMLRARLAARVPGVVDWLPPEIDIGREVKKGEKLLVLAVPDLDARLEHKQAALKEAGQMIGQAEKTKDVADKEWQEATETLKRYESEKKLRDQELKRKSDLAKGAALVPQVVEEAQAQAEAAAAAWEAGKAQVATKDVKRRLAEANIEVAKSRAKVAGAELKHVEEMVGFATIKAPFDGVITRRWVDRGATIKDAGSPLLTVMDTATVWALLDVPERYVAALGHLRLDPSKQDSSVKVTLRLPALRDKLPHGEVEGMLSRTATSIDPNTRTMRVEAHLDNRAGHLRPGMFGRAILDLGQRPRAWTLPSTALVRRGNQALVYYVDEVTGDPPHGVVKKAEIEIGLDDGARVEVRNSQVFRGTEQVIVKGNGVVREGDTITPVPQARKE